MPKPYTKISDLYDVMVDNDLPFIARLKSKDGSIIIVPYPTFQAMLKIGVQSYEWDAVRISLRAAEATLFGTMVRLFGPDVRPPWFVVEHTLAYVYTHMREVKK